MNLKPCKLQIGAHFARAAVLRALLDVHPYEEPAHDVVAIAASGDPAPLGGTGIGRIGTVEETTLAQFAQQVSMVLPPTSHGVRVSGDPHRPVRRVALCGGAGDSLLDAPLLELGLTSAGAVRPAHGELHDLGWAPPGLHVTTSSGARAGEELLEWLAARV